MRGVIVAVLALEAIGAYGCGGRSGHASSAYESHGSASAPHGDSSYERHGGGESSGARADTRVTSARVGTSAPRERREHAGSDARAAGKAVRDVAAAFASSDVGSVDDDTEPPLADDLDGDAVEALIRAVDLTDCRSRGVPPGFGRVRVTVRADGHVTRVAIESPQNLTDDAADCLGSRLGDVVAPPFRGAPTDVYATFYVR